MALLCWLGLGVLGCQHSRKGLDAKCRAGAGPAPTPSRIYAYCTGPCGGDAPSSRVMRIIWNGLVLQYRLVPVDVNEDNGKRFGGGQFDHGGTLTARKDEHQHAAALVSP